MLVLPGMGVGDGSTVALRSHLRSRGCDARGWGLGVHRPVVADNLVRLLEHLEAFAVEARRAVALVGWSLGGVLARELARIRPDLVSRLFTLGAPITGGVRQTALTRFRCFARWNFDEAERQIAAANRIPIRVPLTAFWSRRDGIVAWQACIDLETPGAENLECSSVHWALGFDPDVLEAISDRLAPDTALADRRVPKAALAAPALAPGAR